MGKYPRSKLNEKYSDWHYNVLGKKWGGEHCWCIDIDRLWVEVRSSGKGRIVAIIDIKEPGAEITQTEVIVYNIFEELNLPVYIVKPNWDMTRFEVERFFTKEKFIYSEAEYVNWIKRL